MLCAIIKEPGHKYKQNYPQIEECHQGHRLPDHGSPLREGLGRPAKTLATPENLKWEESAARGALPGSRRLDADLRPGKALALPGKSALGFLLEPFVPTGSAGKKRLEKKCECYILSESLRPGNPDLTENETQGDRYTRTY